MNWAAWSCWARCSGGREGFGEMAAPIPVAAPLTRAVLPRSGWLRLSGASDMTAVITVCFLAAGRWPFCADEHVQGRRGVLALREFDDGQEGLGGGELGEWDDAEDAHGEETAQLREFPARPELCRRAEWSVHPLADARDRGSAGGSSCPPVLRVDVSVVVVEVKLGDRGDRDWGQGEAGGAGVYTGLGAGYLPSAKGE